MKGKQLIFNSPEKVAIQSFDIPKPNDLQILTKTLFETRVYHSTMDHTTANPSTKYLYFTVLEIGK